MNQSHRDTAIQPPFLVVRPGTSFWVEACAPDACVATRQAFQEGCYDAAWGYDAAGYEWPINGATLNAPLSFLQRVLPWSRVAVTLHLGTRAKTDVASVISRMADILLSGNEFCEELPEAPLQVLNQIEKATSMAELIQIARRYD
jgi:hypothetical protein